MPGRPHKSEEPPNRETQEREVPEKNADFLRDQPAVPVDEIQETAQEEGAENQGTVEGENGENPFRAFTQQFLGIPYRFGGESLKGIDCSAFVQRVFRHFNVDLPRTARQQFKAGIKVSKNELHIGDLIFFHTYAKYPSHVGIYIGEGKMIHASSRYRQVSISDWEHPYYKKRFIGVIRIPEIENALSGPILFSSLDP
jgi:cell wall-associated NlpC family hydrolase